MAWTPASFVAAHREFAPTLVADLAASPAGTTVQDALASGVAKCDPRLCGDDTDEAVAMWAGHVLSTAPFGQQARLEDGKEPTDRYLQRWKEIAAMRAGGPWTMGQPAVTPPVLPCPGWPWGWP